MKCHTDSKSPSDNAATSNPIFILNLTGREASYRREFLPIGKLGWFLSEAIFRNRTTLSPESRQRVDRVRAAGSDPEPLITGILKPNSCFFPLIPQRDSAS